jgi:Transposase DDE domain
MIPAPEGADGPICADATDPDPVVQRYRAFFALLDWDRVPERDPRRPWPGSPPHPKRAYIKALLVKLVEGKRFITELRTFLVEHPLLVLEVGFRPVPDPTRRFGFDVGRTVPGDRWLRYQQQTLDPTILTALLAGTVRALAAEIPGLGTTVAVDVKHIYAWVRENNPKERIAHRHEPARQPRGDPDCRLGVKCRTNQAGRQEKEYLWGYGTGLVSTTDPDDGDVVLADLTQPFNCQDVTYFAAVHPQAVAALGRHPTNLAADAAFDAWHVYQGYAERGGLAAIPRNDRGASPPRDPAGHPLCARARSMVPTSQFRHEDGFQAQRYRCPLLRPQPTGTTCDHAQFAKGGCTKYTNLEPGGRMRANLDRRSERYRSLYRQRSSAERINSQAKALGIERPMVRTGASVHRLNTLTYIVINVRALQRIQTRTASLPQPP